jgi:hypothetical protein
MPLPSLGYSSQKLKELAKYSLPVPLPMGRQDHLHSLCLISKPWQLHLQAPSSQGLTPFAFSISSTAP